MGDEVLEQTESNRLVKLHFEFLLCREIKYIYTYNRVLLVFNNPVLLLF